VYYNYGRLCALCFLCICFISGKSEKPLQSSSLISGVFKKVMGRYRAPDKKGSPYITVEGKAVLDKELDYLWNKRRPLVVQALSAAAAEGDRSENAEFTK